MIEQLNGHNGHVLESEDTFTSKGAAAYVGLSIPGIEWNARKGRLPRTKIDDVWHYRKEDLDLFNARRVSSTVEPVVETPPVEDETPEPEPQSHPALLPGEAGLLAQVIATAFAQVGGIGNVKLMELREVTRPLRVWQIRLSVDGSPCTFRVFSDGREVWSKNPME